MNGKLDLRLDRFKRELSGFSGTPESTQAINVLLKAFVTDLFTEIENAVHAERAGKGVAAVEHYAQAVEAISQMKRRILDP